MRRNVSGVPVCGLSLSYGLPVSARSVAACEEKNAPKADRRNVLDDVISVSTSEADSASSNGDDSSYESYSCTSCSGESSDTEPSVLEVSDQHSMLEHTYRRLLETLSRSGKTALWKVMRLHLMLWTFSRRIGL